MRWLNILCEICGQQPVAIEQTAPREVASIINHLGHELSHRSVAMGLRPVRGVKFEASTNWLDATGPKGGSTEEALRNIAVSDPLALALASEVGKGKQALSMALEIAKNAGIPPALVLQVRAELLSIAVKNVNYDNGRGQPLGILVRNPDGEMKIGYEFQKQLAGYFQTLLEKECSRPAMRPPRIGARGCFTDCVIS